MSSYTTTMDKDPLSEGSLSSVVVR